MLVYWIGYPALENFFYFQPKFEAYFKFDPLLKIFLKLDRLDPPLYMTGQIHRTPPCMEAEYYC